MTKAKDHPVPELKMPVFMRGDKGRGLEHLDVEDFSWNFDADREKLAGIVADIGPRRALEVIVKAVVAANPDNKRHATDRVRAIMDASLGGTTMGRPPSDDVLVMLQIARAVRDDLRRDQAKKRSWHQIVVEIARTLPGWDKRNVESQESEIRRLRDKFQAQAAPLLEIVRTGRDRYDDARAAELVASILKQLNELGIAACTD